MKATKDVLSENQISQYKYARKRQLVSKQNKLKETKMLRDSSLAVGISFAGLSSWLLYSEISVTTTIQNAAVMSIGAGGVVAFMFITVPTVVYAIELKNFKEFKKQYDELEQH